MFESGLDNRGLMFENDMYIRLQIQCLNIIEILKVMSESKNFSKRVMTKMIRIILSLIVAYNIADEETSDWIRMHFYRYVTALILELITLSSIRKPLLSFVLSTSGDYLQNQRNFYLTYSIHHGIDHL